MTGDRAGRLAGILVILSVWRAAAAAATPEASREVDAIIPDAVDARLLWTDGAGYTASPANAAGGGRWSARIPDSAGPTVLFQFQSRDAAGVVTLGPIYSHRGHGYSRGARGGGDDRALFDPNVSASASAVHDEAGVRLVAGRVAVSEEGRMIVTLPANPPGPGAAVASVFVRGDGTVYSTPFTPSGVTWGGKPPR